MNRGDIIVAIFASEFGKPRPSLVIQSNNFSNLNTLVICPLTTDLKGQSPLRILVHPSPSNGLREPSHIMIDKIAAVSSEHRRDKIGELNADEMEIVSQQLSLLLGITD